MQKIVVMQQCILSITVCDGNIALDGGVENIVSHQTSFHAYAINLHSDCTEQTLMSTQEDT